MTRNVSDILSSLTDAALLALAERDDLTPAMVQAMAAEAGVRAKAARDRAEAIRRQQARAALDAYYADSVGGSVLADYRAGRVRTIWAGPKK